jgi:hypothetical protein
MLCCIDFLRSDVFLFAKYNCTRATIRVSGSSKTGLVNYRITCISLTSGDVLFQLYYCIDYKIKVK